MQRAWGERAGQQVVLPGVRVSAWQTKLGGRRYRLGLGAHVAGPVHAARRVGVELEPGPLDAIDGDRHAPKAQLAGLLVEAYLDPTAFTEHGQERASRGLEERAPCALSRLDAPRRLLRGPLRRAPRPRSDHPESRGRVSVTRA
jgi:hypothetical protein